ncbi:MAG: pantoate--beta-alanine ligase [Fibromonadaceae bacterium]|jgi:pantoate--beta-alanine ligase|nr:pantoate--beta-alanine ligase [Fibromonadaceae bacterium]
MRKNSAKIQIIRKPRDLQKISKKMLMQGKSIGLVPTMGALHKGHISLIKKSAKSNEVTIVSIFVNPTQFGANEDFAKYPRRLQVDAKLCAEAGASIVFAPEPKDMYPAPLQTFAHNPCLETLYCGACRPGHFSGVLSVVAKLFNISMPSKAYFGEKDFQQLFLIRKMAFDLNFPIKVIGVKTIREHNGLAMSSRNEYMSLKEREAASSIYAGLLEAKNMHKKGIYSVAKLKEAVKKKIKSAGGKIQYVEVASKSDLQPVKAKAAKGDVILLACFFGKTRLIDHAEL